MIRRNKSYKLFRLNKPTLAVNLFLGFDPQTIVIDTNYADHYKNRINWAKGSIILKEIKVITDHLALVRYTQKESVSVDPGYSTEYDEIINYPYITYVYVIGTFCAIQNNCPEMRTLLSEFLKMQKNFSLEYTFPDKEIFNEFERLKIRSAKLDFSLKLDRINPKGVKVSDENFGQLNLKAKDGEDLLDSKMAKNLRENSENLPALSLILNLKEYGEVKIRITNIGTILIYGREETQIRDLHQLIFQLLYETS